jgi:uncharacterized paraquat-inducible protein A
MTTLRKRAEEAEKRLQNHLDADERKRKLEAEQKAKEKWYNARTYCSNCQTVNDYRIKEGVSIQDGGCIRCQVRGSNIYPVKIL